MIACKMIAICLYKLYDSSVVVCPQVDIDLFLTLTDRDLIEIGIEHERDRCALLDAIEECKRCKTY